MIYRLMMVTGRLLAMPCSAHDYQDGSKRTCLAIRGARGKRTVHTDVFVSQLVGETHTLGLVLHRLAVDDGVLELLENGAMDGVTLRTRKYELQRNDSYGGVV